MVSASVSFSHALLRPSPRSFQLAPGESAWSCASIFHRAYSYLELSLLFQRPFLTYSLAITFFNCGYFVPYVHLVAHSRNEGFSQYQV